MAPTQLKTLQIGRGLAALAVCAFHLSVYLGQQTGEAVFSAFTERGFLGVDFFFVLSGFIILHAHAGDMGRPGRWGAYAYKRFVRVYPIYWIYTAVLVAALLVGVGDTPLPTGVWNWVSSIALVRVTDIRTPLPQAWTLFYEVLFYAVFSVLILSRRAGLALIAAWLTGVAIMRFYPELSPAGVMFGLYNLNFFIGMAAYLVAPKLSLRQAAAVGLLGVGMLAGTYAFDPDLHRPGRLLYAVAFGLMLAGAVGFERHRRVDIPLLGTLGNASYTIYLTHALLLSTAWKVLRPFISLPGPAMYALLFVVAVTGGVVLYLWVEKPVLNLLRRRRRPAAEPAPLKVAI
jgi:peptidoglycan/LPS O-acetylase OafA/YrhL